MTPTKLMPSAVELEDAIIGALLIENHRLDDVTGIIFTDNVFYDRTNKIIFKAIKRLSEEGSEIDILTVSEFLKENDALEGIGGDYTLVKKTRNVVSSANIEAHSRIVVEKYMLRKIAEVGNIMFSKAFENGQDVFEVMDEANKMLTELELKAVGSPTMHVREPVMSVNERIAKNRAHNVRFTGMPTGYTHLDRLTGGWQKTDLIILAARPSVGKTGFALSLALNAASHPEYAKPILFCSLEMSKEQLTTRLIASKGNVPINAIRNPIELNGGQINSINSASEHISKLPIYIDDTASISPARIKAKARQLQKKVGLGMIIIDYLQLMQLDGSKRLSAFEETTKISQALKAMAKTLNVPVMALSQLSRKVEDRGGNKPKLSDLRQCLPMDEWVYTPDGVKQFKEKPSKTITTSSSGQVISKCDFIEKKYNKTYLVKSQYGSFRATRKHLVLTGTGWKQVRHLVPNRDVIASPKIIPHANKGAQPHARLLGWLLGNGGLSGTPSLVYRKELDSLVKKEVAKFGVTVNYRKTQESNNVWSAYLSNGVASGSVTNPLMAWIRSLGLEGTISHTKFIPEAYMGSSNETHIELLKGLWETDGTVTGGRAKYATVSELLARQISWLLLTIGVRSTLSFQKNIWEVRCSMVDNNNMKQIVDNSIRFGDLKSPKEHYIDPSPTIFIELIDELYPGQKERLQKRANGQYKSISKERMLRILKGCPVSTISTSPYMTMPEMGWGRLYSVEDAEENARVCDLHVPITHNFITNGIVVHNSGQIEQDADVVMFLYNPTEKEIDEGYAENINLRNAIFLDIQKHRNGGLDMMPIFVNKPTQAFTENPDDYSSQFPSSNPF